MPRWTDQEIETAEAILGKRLFGRLGQSAAFREIAKAIGKSYEAVKMRYHGRGPGFVRTIKPGHGLPRVRRPRQADFRNVTPST